LPWTLRWICGSLAVILFCLLITTFIAPGSSARIIFVDQAGGGDNETIADALEVAVDGDTIRVYDGIYKETIIVDKEVDIYGNGIGKKTIIDAEGHESPVKITADNVTLSDLTVTNSSDIGENAGVKCTGINATLLQVEASGNGQYGMFFSNGRNIFLSDCTIEDNGAFGLNVRTTHYSTFSDCRINSNKMYGFYLEGSYNTVSNCMITQTKEGPGMLMGPGSNNTIDRCKISDNDLHGIDLVMSTNNSFLNTIFSSNNFYGLQAFGIGEGNTIANCTFFMNFLGISIWVTNFDISDCTILSNLGVGIQQNEGNGSSIVNNSISGNGGYGITLGNCTNNTIHHNEMLNNMKSAYDDGNNVWDDGYPSGGNWWSDFNEENEGAYDNDTDGIVDDPYPIQGGDNEDRFPLGGGAPTNEAPIADAGKDWGVFTNYTLTFDGSGSTDDGLIVNWTWTFKDLGIKTLYGVDPSYKFENKGDFFVTLTVRDNEGLEDNDIMVVNVTKFGEDFEPPHADAGPDRLVASNQIIKFHGGSSTDNRFITNYTWEFEDGVHSILYGVEVRNTFLNDGVFNVTLTVFDLVGNSDSDNVTITVSSEPAGIMGVIVTKENGDPIENARIILSDQTAYRDLPDIYTNESGAFKNLNLIPHHRYLVHYGHENYSFMQETIELLPGEIHEVEIILEEREKEKEEGEKWYEALNCCGAMTTFMGLVLIVGKREQVSSRERTHSHFNKRKN